MISHLDKVKEDAGFIEDSDDPVEFVIYSLKNTNLPTVVVEGCHDKAVYRWIERLFNMPKIDVLPANGKENLIEIYERRSEYANQIAVAFMADLDKEVFDTLGKGYKARYKDIIWTQGYSLENDLYSDGNPEDTYIDLTKKDQHEIQLDNAIHEFAKEVACWAKHGKSPSTEDIDNYFWQIKKEYKLRLRGKNLFDVLLNFCNARNHLELYKDVFDTIDLDKGNPPLISKLIFKIQEEIKNKQDNIKEAQPSRKFIAESLFAKH